VLTLMCVPFKNIIVCSVNTTLMIKIVKTFDMLECIFEITIIIFLTKKSQLSYL